MTVWYATALILSIAVFAVVLYFARRSATYQDLDRRIQSAPRAITRAASWWRRTPPAGRC
jgi:ubiquinone biosynthesis protein COQ9